MSGSPVDRKALTGLAPSAAAAAIAELTAIADMFASRGFPRNTARAYGRQWRNFEIWAQALGLKSLPADGETIRLFLADLGRKYGVSTVAQASAAIWHRHRLADFTLSEGERALIDITKRGIRRTKTGERKRRAPPLLAADVAKMTAIIHPDLAGLRDRALIGLGFDFGLRRSEIGKLDLDDGSVEITAAGVTLRLGVTKRDQEGRKDKRFSRPRRLGPDGRPSPLCPVAWLEAWILAAGGLDHIRLKGEWCRPLFRAIDKYGRLRETRLSDDAIRRIVRKRARDAGLDRTVDFSAHSLRAGAITTWLDSGIDLAAAAKLVDHASLESTRIYDRRGPGKLGAQAAAANAAAFLPERAPEGPGRRPVKAGGLGSPEALRAAERGLEDVSREVAELLKRPAPST